MCGLMDMNLQKFEEMKRMGKMKVAFEGWFHKMFSIKIALFLDVNLQKFEEFLMPNRLCGRRTHVPGSLIEVWINSF